MANGGVLSRLRYHNISGALTVNECNAVRQQHEIEMSPQSEDHTDQRRVRGCAVVARNIIGPSSIMPLALGSLIGPYEIVSLIGTGGMGEVYRARDTRLGRDVAIKVLPEAFAADPDRVRRFEQEARAIAALNHPHICQIHDVGPGYLVLEYVEGTPLYGPLGVEEVVRLAVQIVTALEAAHRHGILHRDLKPGNILVTRNQGASYPPVAKLLDFGLAKSLVSAADATRTVEGTIAGTAAYMSPEQTQGKSVDARSDVFSLGAVLYELISGQRAFRGDTSAEVDERRAA